MVLPTTKEDNMFALIAVSEIAIAVGTVWGVIIALAVTLNRSSR